MSNIGQIECATQKRVITGQAARRNRANLQGKHACSLIFHSPLFRSFLCKSWTDL